LVFGFSKFGKQGKPAAHAGWVACVPQGDHAALALVQPAPAQGKPVLCWALQTPWDEPGASLQRLRRSHHLQRHRRVALLQRGQYQCVTMDVPADVPRADWADATRWQLREAVDFELESAAVDVLAVPEGTSYRPTPQLIAVAAADHQVRPLVTLAHGVGLPWHAVDVAETALRNLSLLVGEPQRARALLHCQPGHATLVVTCQGELLSTRQMYLNLLDAHSAPDDVRAAAYEQAALELQRTLDGIERAYGQVSLAQLLITPMPGVQALCDHLRPLLYVPVAPLDLRDALDWQAMPELPGDDALLNPLLLAIGAALRQD